MPCNAYLRGLPIRLCPNDRAPNSQYCAEHRGFYEFNCCDQMRVIHGCVCTRARKCPVHGEKHEGTHD